MAMNVGGVGCQKLFDVIAVETLAAVPAECGTIGGDAAEGGEINDAVQPETITAELEAFSAEPLPQPCRDRTLERVHFAPGRNEFASRRSPSVLRANDPPLLECCSAPGLYAPSHLCPQRPALHSNSERSNCHPTRKFRDRRD